MSNVVSVHKFVDLGRVADQIREITSYEGVNCLPRHLNHGETFGDCPWCAYEPAGPAVIDWVWDRGSHDNAGQSVSCVACAGAVIERALEDSDHHLITAEYPVFTAEHTAQQADEAAA